MSSMQMKSIISLLVVGMSTAVLFQNCGGIGGKAPANSGNQSQSVAVVCQPTDNCLSYSLATFGTQDCFAGYNMVQVQNLPAANGNSVTDVRWNKCLIRSATEACCPTGAITASFATVSGDRSIVISFSNSPTAFLNSSNKMTGALPAGGVEPSNYNPATDSFNCGDKPCEMIQE
jgi:hypothetical protein